MTAPILGHIIGLDEISKKTLRKSLPSSIKIIDLDSIQQSVYNSSLITERKHRWSTVSQEINAKRQQVKMAKGLRIGTKNIEADIDKLMAERNGIKQDIHSLWKQQMGSRLQQLLTEASVAKRSVLYIGFNIYPKDYRTKIALGITPAPTSTIDPIPNCLILETEPSTYSSNQIQFYLDRYRDRIVRGVFPLNLLKKEYLTAKYNKFTEFYHRLKYTYIELDAMPRIIKELHSRQAQLSSIDHTVFIATLHQCGDTIPINPRTPLQAFLTREEAITHIKPQVRLDAPIYLYELEPSQFQMINGKLIATQTLRPCTSGEPMLISDVP